MLKINEIIKVVKDNHALVDIFVQDVESMYVKYMRDGRKLSNISTDNTTIQFCT